MSEFDIKAADWDQNPMHRDRSAAVADELLKQVPLNKKMTALEFGAGTGITSFLIKDHLKKITMIDSSSEMVRIINEKIQASKADNLKAVCFDLEKHDWHNGKFDLIFSQMVLHHVVDIEDIISKFCHILNPGGYLAISDLYPEDGSFHGKEFTGHKGFDPAILSEHIRKHDFKNISYKKCYIIKKQISDIETRQFDVFLLTAKGKNN